MESWQRVPLIHANGLFDMLVGIVERRLEIICNHLCIQRIELCNNNKKKHIHAVGSDILKAWLNRIRISQ